MIIQCVVYIHTIDIATFDGHIFYPCSRMRDSDDTIEMQENMAHNHGTDDNE